MKNFFNKKTITLAGVIVFSISVYLAFTHNAALINGLFLYPSAKTASLFLGTACLSSPEGYILPHKFMDITVLPECSGAYFWLILYSWLLFLLMEKYPVKKGILYSLIALPVSFIAAWGANSMRIVSSFWLYLFIRHFFSMEMLNIIHQAAGILIFLPVLMAAGYIIKGGNIYGKKSC